MISPFPVHDTCPTGSIAVLGVWSDDAERRDKRLFFLNQKTEISSFILRRRKDLILSPRTFLLVSVTPRFTFGCRLSITGCERTWPRVVQYHVRWSTKYLVSNHFAITAVIVSRTYGSRLHSWSALSRARAVYFTQYRCIVVLAVRRSKTYRSTYSARNLNLRADWYIFTSVDPFSFKYSVYSFYTRAMSAITRHDCDKLTRLITSKFQVPTWQANVARRSTAFVNS